jgi:hypothetical protein
MIGIPGSPGAAAGEYGVRLDASPGLQFEVGTPLVPLGNLPQPARWLILLSVLLVASFIAHRRWARR